MAPVRKPVAERQQEIVGMMLQLPPELSEGSLFTQIIANQFEEHPEILPLLLSTGRLAAEGVVHPTLISTLTSLRLRVVEESIAAAKDCDPHIETDTLKMESVLIGAVHDRVLRWSLPRYECDLVGAGNQMTGSQPCLPGPLQRAPS